MKKSLLFLFLVCSITISAQVKNTTITPENPQSPPPKSPTTTTNFDENLAKELGADDYGMRKYVMAFLKKGPNRPKDKAKADELQTAHMANINRLAKEGKLAIAGPFLDNGELRGIYIFNVETVEEAKALTETDPAIKAGSLVMELHPWYGSATLGLVNKYHDKISKVKM